MIDLDRMDEQLASALTVDVAPRPRPSAPPKRPPAAPARAVATPAPALAPAPAPAPARTPVTVPEMLELGRIEEADACIAATSEGVDRVTWDTMRALLDGRRDAATAGMEELARLARAAGDPEASERWWAQRFWAAFEGGTEAERHDVLDHCRDRAYRFDELAWWGNLTLLLAAMGKQDEAVRAFDHAAPLVAAAEKDARRLDAVTNLVEAGTALGDAARVVALCRSVRWPEGRLVVVNGGAVCKGSVERYRALAFAAAGRWEQADECFRSAESAHRAIGAGPLLTRTLQQASGTSVAA